jgi:hypothetical protein
MMAFVRAIVLFPSFCTFFPKRAMTGRIIAAAGRPLSRLALAKHLEPLGTLGQFFAQEGSLAARSVLSLGARVKHRMRNNWLKMHDKFGVVLRIETGVMGTAIRPYFRGLNTAA